jgi:hypothetical protein
MFVMNTVMSFFSVSEQGKLPQGGPVGRFDQQITYRTRRINNTKRLVLCNKTAMLWEEATTTSHARARALYVMVQACHKVAIQLAKAIQQVPLGRPRGAREAVDEARTGLTAPPCRLSFTANKWNMPNETVKDAAKEKVEEERKDDGPGATAAGNHPVMSCQRLKK